MKPQIEKTRRKTDEIEPNSEMEKSTTLFYSKNASGLSAHQLKTNRKECVTLPTKCTTYWHTRSPAGNLIPRYTYYTRLRGWCDPESRTQSVWHINTIYIRTSEQRNKQKPSYKQQQQQHAQPNRHIKNTHTQTDRQNKQTTNTDTKRKSTQQHAQR